MDSLTNNSFLKKDQYLNLIILTIIFLGAALRLFHYFYDRSLWMDETYLSASFSHLSYTDLATKVLDHQQKAPIGFLWLVKLSVNLFGNNEMALRAIPLLSGIISLFIFARINRYFLNSVAQIMALAIFSFAPAFIYHSVEIKQYSTECLATIIALYLFIRYKDSQSWKMKICWGIWGAVTLWFAYAVIFILAGIAAGMSLYDLLRKNWKQFWINIVPFSIWMISFGLNYIFFTHKHAESEWIVYFFKTYDNFMPFPPHTLEQLKWFPRNFQAMMDYPLGLVWTNPDFNKGLIFKILNISIIPAILLFTGIFSISRNQKQLFYVLIFPAAFMLFASGIALYPLIERFWLFIAPIFILFIAFGFQFFEQKIKNKWIIALIFILITFSSVAQATYYLFQPQKFYKHKKSYQRESLQYINNHFKEGDAVYNYWNNHPGFGVYKVILPLKFKAIEGRDYRKESKDLADYNHHLQSDLRKFTAKKRVWLIFNTQFLTDIGDLADDPKWYYKSKYSPTQNLVREFDKIGKPVDKQVYTDVTIYLFELDKP